MIAENEPTMFNGDPDLFAARLAYHNRDLEEELTLIDQIRKQIARILGTLCEAEFLPDQSQKDDIFLLINPQTFEAV